MKREQERILSITGAGILAGLLAAAIVAPEPARAADGMIFGGQVCQGGTPVDRSRLAYLGPYLQSAGGATGVLCPIDRDWVQGELGNVWVRLFRNGNNPVLTCTMHSVSAQGDFIDTESKSFSDAGPGTLHFALDGFAHYALGSYVLACNLGSSDRIYSIRIDDDTVNKPDDFDLLDALPGCGEPIANGFSEERIAFPEPDSADYVIPAAGDTASLVDSIEHLVSGDMAGAMSHATDAGYQLCRGEHHEHSIVRWTPVSAGTGQAVLALRTRGARGLIIAAPHPLADIGTLEQSVTMFQDVHARALIVSGTHRCANLSSSGCDGNTRVCGGSLAPYRESDMAHAVDSHFHLAHNALADAFIDDWVANIHGMSADGAIISNGTQLTTVATSPVARVTVALAAQFPDLPIATCNEFPGSPTNIRLCGTNNVQGRYVNGVTSGECTEAAQVASERFLHIEQSSEVRDEPQRLNDVFKSLLPF